MKKELLPGRKPRLMIVDGSIAVTGALVSAARQAKLLANEVETILVLPRGHRVKPERTAAFAQVIDLPIVALRKDFLSIISYLPSLIVASVQLRREMRRLNCTRLQLNDFYLLHGAMLRLMNFRGRIITFVRIDPLRFGMVGKIWLAAARWSSTELIAVSRHIQSRLGQRGAERLIYEHVAPSRPRKAGSSADKLFLFVGNYIGGKGQEHALNAFHIIAGRYPNARLRFVGGVMGLKKNQLFRNMLERCASAGVAADRIELSGEADDLQSHYADAFVALNFSESESFSLTCLDASSAGVPLIATRCGGPEEIVDDGKSGFLVRVGDVAAMAERMAWMLDHPEEAAAMGAAGQSLVAQRFSRSHALAELRAALGLAPPGA